MNEESLNHDDEGVKPELVFGLVGPLGSDLKMVERFLVGALERVRYDVSTIRLSRLMHDLPNPPWSELVEGPRADELAAHMDAGNELRSATGRNDAVAMLGVSAIRAERERLGIPPNQALKSRAYVFYSLKRPEEINSLRTIYGSTFFVIAAFSPRSRRVKDLALRIADSVHENQLSDHISAAESLIARDEEEVGVESGQDVRHAFQLADVIVNTTDAKSAEHEIGRFIDILFGNTFQTPTRDEEAMFLAQGAAFRSASLARQVGAAITRGDGSLVAVGCNEVAKAQGGQYWNDDKEDGRDFRLGYDSSVRMRENLLGDIYRRLHKNGWIASTKRNLTASDFVKESLRGEDPFMKQAQFNSTIDFVRAVHAEMAAITTAARHGLSVNGCTLYTTTFPCHDCAKHIIASGISRVVFIEPYPKSLVQELYSDSVILDELLTCSSKMQFVSFVGIAPSRYSQFFALLGRKRKKSDGSAIEWRAAQATPHLGIGPAQILSYRVSETRELEDFRNVLVDEKIIEAENQTEERDGKV